jgi:hypothetical protein
MPTHRPTKEQRQNVTLLAGLGATPSMIAGALGVETETVTRAYSAELAAGPDQVKLQAMQELFRAARGDGAGKVMAVTRLLDLLTQDDDKPDATAAVRKSGKTRLVTCRNDMGLWAGDRQVSVFTEDGDQVLVVSEDEANM